MAASRPNFLLVITDHQRADSIDMVQGGVEVTPRLNRFASGAARFTRAYTTSPLCIPARTAMMTGQYPTRGIPINDFSGDAARPQTLATCDLAAAGYRVAYIGKNDIQVRPSGRDQHPAGTWIDKRDYEQGLHQQGLPRFPGWEGREDAYHDVFYKPVRETLPDRVADSRYSHPATGSWSGPQDSFRDFFFQRATRKWLEQAARGPEPFAGVISIPSPHPPLIVPPPYDTLFDPETLDIPPNVGVPARGEPSNRAESVARQLARDASEADHRRAWAAHLGLVRLADDLFGELLDDLDRLKIADNTVVIFTSDHGHHLGQHNMFGINELYEQTVHVPLLIRAPGCREQTIRSPVSHLDIVPTLFHLAGLPPADHHDGQSLHPTLFEGTPPNRRECYFQFSGQIGYGYYRRGVVSQTYKYIYDPADIPELYHLVKDPLEMCNVAADPAYASTLDDLHARCAAWHRQCGDWIRFENPLFPETPNLS